MPDWPCGWDVIKDTALLRGVHMYGVGNYERVKEDRTFGLSDIILPETKSSVSLMEGSCAWPMTGIGISGTGGFDMELSMIQRGCLSRRLKCLALSLFLHVLLTAATNQALEYACGCSVQGPAQACIRQGARMLGWDPFALPFASCRDLGL